ncbi:hypothetical protein [Nocardia neocaledoniensis]|uniref:hypothetical protein n=1 Tax=Nocardia neocaledoniensis TaxID=236511 RepID=UPI002456577C|nr:hypothetical protein [Nocardia neocaledoniensis]
MVLMLIILFVLLAGLAVAGLVALVISLAGRTDPRSRRRAVDPGWSAGTYGVYGGSSSPPHEHGPGCGGGSSNSGCRGGSTGGCGGGSSSGCGGGSSSSCGGGSSSSCGGGSSSSCGGGSSSSCGGGS